MEKKTLAESDNRWKRVVDIETGTIMVVTDLHGDWEAYQRYRNRFLELYRSGRAQYLVITGDLIHYSGPPEEDGSLQMVLDVMSLRERLGERIVYLLGNHELPHLYSITLQKGKHLYTPAFEAAMGEHRHQILSLFDQLPFYVRTRGGVTISHAGATTAMGDSKDMERLFNFSHRRIWRETAESMPPEIRPSLRRALSKTSKQSYDEMVRKYFAVTGPDDPRYDHFLIGAVSTTSHPDFQLLWDAMFTRNELQFGKDGYEIVLAAMLRGLSKDHHPQRVIVAGHMNCKKGYKVVNKHQLRMASAHHAIPRRSGVYLLLDAQQEVQIARELVPNLASVFTTKNQ